MKYNKFWHHAVKALALVALTFNATDIFAGRIEVEDIYREDGNITVVLGLDLPEFKQARDRETVFTPMLVNGADTARFESFTFAGRNRWYRTVREHKETPLLYKGWGKELSATYGGMSSLHTLTFTAPYRSWMEQATLIVEEEVRGCSDCPKSYSQIALAETDFVPKVYVPDFIYVTPVAEAVKTREVSGRAFIDFKVNQTVILPDYRSNGAELAKITATIDSVKNDPDITVTSLTIKGTASPEGPWTTNEKLAKGRTEALKDYVQKLYRFPQGFIKTSWVAEDWDGLREWVEHSTIDNREGILALIDSNTDPDTKNTKIQMNYPVQYKYLLENVYPSLRHSDYNIDFTIRTFTSVDEILAIMQTTPQKLSLAELFTAANSQPEGSELYTEAFEIAVRMYPLDPAANLNAAIAAMKRADLRKAQLYLDKAGMSDETQYARAVLSALEGDTLGALEQFSRLADKPGSPVADNAAAAVASLNAIINANGTTFKKL